MADPSERQTLHLEPGQIAQMASADAAVLDPSIRQHLSDCLRCSSLFTAALGGAQTIPAQGGTGEEPTAVHLDPRRPGPEASERIGRYLVLGKVADGGMGSVLSAYDPELDRKVALKLVRFDLASGSTGALLQDRLRAEGRIMARLSHPNVVQVFDVGSRGDGLYIAMEWVNGESLRAWQSRPHPPSEILARYLEAGRGLVAAHRAGLVHRDFKPDNVLIDRQGQVRVTDFGLARRDVPGEALTSPGEVLGTPGYMPAEQLKGQVIDARADQFAYCVSLYEALYGQMPFEGATFLENARAVIDGKLVPPPAGAAVPGYVWPLLRRGLEADPQARFPELTQLLDALGRDPSKRRRSWALAAAGAALLVSAGAWEARRLTREAHRCADSANGAVAFWSPAARSAMSTAFLAIQKPYAADNLSRVTQTLDREVAGWIAEQTAWCQTAREKPQDQALLRAGEALQRRRDALAVAVEVFSSAGEADVLHAPMAIASLEARVRGSSPAEQPAAATDAAAAAELERAELLRADGQLDEAMHHALAATERAHAAGDPGSEARGLYLQARALYGGNDEQGRAEHLLKRGVRLASSAGADEIAARCRLTLIDVIASDPKRAPEVGDAVEDAAAAIARVGNPPALMASLLDVQAQFYTETGDFERARLLLEKSIALNRQIAGPKGFWTATSLNNLGVLEGRLGNWKASLAAFRESTEIDREALGPRNPDVGRSMIGESSNLSELGEDREALKRSAEGYAILRESLGDQSTDTAWALGAMAEAELELGMLDQALAHASEALKIVDAAKENLDPNLRFGMIDLLSEVDLKMGRIEQASQYAEEGVEAFKQGEGLATPLAQAEYHLSQALWSRQPQRARAVKLADDALKLMPRTERHQPELVAWAAKIHAQR